MEKSVLEADFVRENKTGDVVKYNAYQVAKQALKGQNVQLYISNGSGAGKGDYQIANLAKSFVGEKK